ncbi:hypothetical protein [Caldimonas brevitalea]|uniref:Uncharacterized protein n=1 Tax=Caldimonas brevitalea TaxID=413882 RepID=A0A0G3BLE5_9BURK|nr:hypothetical protein [Caldimonas brevitalea]AKJ28773.1 hypothetical protein AAW51_2082 [Caldimonas brevitalea]
MDIKHGLQRIAAPSERNRSEFPPNMVLEPRPRPLYAEPSRVAIRHYVQVMQMKPRASFMERVVAAMTGGRV